MRCNRKTPKSKTKYFVRRYKDFQCRIRLEGRSAEKPKRYAFLKEGQRRLDVVTAERKHWHNRQRRSSALVLVRAVTSMISQLRKSCLSSGPTIRIGIRWKRDVKY
ncbi:uncharacterized protein BO66DRAFT_31228 [Aspergillus aculeatinus CBS 121060]|uniref:Uncharacterized protein n=1 Tax=Aspergillus aculeatinus CBS 121060 TaxID=1448322 RepID=A0ACD1HFQ8_9EURO|nr:hypothetical protein BO66DRAFT_31228 [Aspergillus aculeatinus CBS 121060]RAH72302.1 hypothetical protein BO66DRAFT_31228 [Aspergillus aculeatinus CBS 121060]